MTRCTPTSASIDSAPKRACAGRRWAESRGRSSSPPSEPSTSCRRERSARSPQLRNRAVREVRLPAFAATLARGMTSAPGLDTAVERSDLVKEALATAQRAHAGQLRRGSDGRPFIDHPVAVAELLCGERQSDEVIAAALLHDVVEKS